MMTCNKLLANLWQNAKKEDAADPGGGAGGEAALVVDDSGDRNGAAPLKAFPSVQRQSAGGAHIPVLTPHTNQPRMTGIGSRIDCV